LRSWQTKEQLTELLVELVRVPSITGSEAEVDLARELHRRIAALPYFKENPEHVELHETRDGRLVVTALAEAAGADDRTAVLINHMDVVEVGDYAELSEMAFKPRQLTRQLNAQPERLPAHVQEELEEGEWLFGRGVMDMKAGTVLQLSLLERAAAGDLGANVLFVSVPDEEGSSFGMVSAVPVLQELAEKHDLDCRICVDSEPSFPRHPGDTHHYFYTGSIGKINIGVACFGTETHAGEPFAGLNAAHMVSEVVRELELNVELCELVDDELTPPPTVLSQRDGKESYSSQTPFRAFALFNLLYMERSPVDSFHLLCTRLEAAAETVRSRYRRRFRSFAARAGSVGPNGQPSSAPGIDVLTFQELREEAEAAHGTAAVERLLERSCAEGQEAEDRKQEGFVAVSARAVAAVAELCRDRWPMVVCYVIPPFYPAVNSSGTDSVRRACSTAVRELGSSCGSGGEAVRFLKYFPGVSDLSFVSVPTAPVEPVIENLPLWNRGYTLPLAAARELDLAVLNLGPVGRAAHKWTERLELNFSFGVLPDVMAAAVEAAVGE
jgi:arginine utilization protein RocB